MNEEKKRERAKEEKEVVQHMAKERKRGCLERVGREWTNRWKGPEMRSVERTLEMDQNKKS